MTRKLFVNILALAVVFVLGGAALAATGVPVPFMPDALSNRDAGVLDIPVETGTARPETDTARPDNFGQIRSEEVRAFGECMRDADTAEQRDACHESRPGPATENPAHPVFGDNPVVPGGAPDDVDDDTTAQNGPEPQPPTDLPEQAQQGQERAAEAREQGQDHRAEGQERAAEGRAQRPPTPDEGETEEPEATEPPANPTETEQTRGGPPPQADHGQSTAEAARADGPSQAGGNAQGRGAGRG